MRGEASGWGNAGFCAKRRLSFHNVLLCEGDFCSQTTDRDQLDMSIMHTLELLDALKELGFNDESFWRLHHFRESNKNETIARFRQYCEKQNLKSSEFEPNGTNESVCERLDFVLKTYKALGLSFGQTMVFAALAEASFFGIPRR